MAPADGQPESHSEEGGDQDEIAEIREGPDLTRDPANERELEGQDPEGRQGDLERDGAAALRPTRIVADRADGGDQRGPTGTSSES
jgi:hypothetical protein